MMNVRTRHEAMVRRIFFSIGCFIAITITQVHVSLYEGKRFVVKKTMHARIRENKPVRIVTGECFSSLKKQFCRTIIPPIRGVVYNLNTYGK
jgi:hypothetical protein